MLQCLIGSLTALVLMSGWHNRQVTAISNHKADSTARVGKT
jgi:hypothetical protein